jgi:signal transduction histidine kinase
MINKFNIKTKLTLSSILVVLVVSTLITWAHYSANQQIAKAQMEVERYQDARNWTIKLLVELRNEELALRKWLVEGDIQQIGTILHSQELLRQYRNKIAALFATDNQMQITIQELIEPALNYLEDIDSQLRRNPAYSRQLGSVRLKGNLSAEFKSIGEFLSQLEREQTQTMNVLAAVSQRAQRVLLLLLLGLTGLAIVVSYLFARVLTTSLQTLIKGIRKIGAGEYPIIAGVRPGDEIGEVVSAYNLMVTTIQANETALRDKNEELVAQGEELAAQNEEILTQQEELQHALTNLTEHEELLSRLFQFSQSLTQTIELDRLVEIAFHGILVEAQAQIGALLLYNAETEALELKTAVGVAGLQQFPALKLDTSLAGRAAREQQPLVVGYDEGQLYTQGLHGQLAMASEIYLPLVFHDDLLGVIALGRTGKKAFSSERQKLLSSLAAQITVALHNSLVHLRLQQSLKHVQAVDQLKSELLNTVSHELRTPLASIFGFTELLLKKPPKADQAEKYLNVIYQEAQRLTELLDQFLDLQRIESGHFELQKKAVNLEQLIRNNVEIYRGQSKKHTIKVKIESDLPLVTTDPDRFTQVLGNLLSNAIKYSPGGGVIEISAVRRSAQEVEVAVKDQGLGIPREALPRLFQPFFRVDNTDRRQIGGTGLGLAICQKTIRTLGGDIWVRSEYGKGSTFTCSLPME